MKDIGGKGRMGLWITASRGKLNRQPGSLTLDAGCMLSITRGSAWLFSVGAGGLGTIGIGWVTRAQRQLDAAATAAHTQAHAEGREHVH